MTDTTTDEGWTLGSAPVVFSGTPSTCIGVLKLENPTEKAVKIRRMPLKGAPVKGPALGGKVELYKRLEPGETGQVVARLVLDPGTPPGTYEQVLEVGGAKREVVVHVLEHRELQAFPSNVSASVEPGGTLTVPVAVQNAGNVPIALPDSFAVELQSDWGLAEQFHASVREHGHEGYQRCLDDLVAKLADAEPPPARGRIVSDNKKPLAPQEARSVEVEVRLPDQLKRNHTYTAVPRIAGATLALRLHVPPKDQQVG